MMITRRARSSSSRGRRRLVGGLVVAVTGALVAITGATPVAQQATFRAGVDLVVVDTQVLDRDGVPIGQLGAKNFQVWINNQSRRVISADLVHYPLDNAMNLAPAADRPDWIHGDLPDVRGRLIVLAIDELSFGQVDFHNAMKTVKQFVSRLEPDDVVGVYTYPIGTGTLDLTHYHTTVSRRLDNTEGLDVPFEGEFTITPSEVIDLTARDSIVMNRIIARECSASGKNPTALRNATDDFAVINPLSLQDPSCPTRILAEANARAATEESQTMQSYLGLRDLLKGLAALPGPKTVVLVSGGMLSSDRVGGRPDVTSLLKTAGRDAAAADAMLYVLQLDNHFFQTAGTTNSKGARYAEDLFLNETRDAQAMANGLMQVAGEAGGAYFRVTAGTGELAFNRVLRETSAYYLLGVEPQTSDRDGRVHYIRVKTDAKNATVRSRQQVTIPAR